MLCLGCSTCSMGNGLLIAETAPPWVSCFANTPSGEWKGPKTVRTPFVTSEDGQPRAYAVIEAKAGGPVGCLNTVRLFVSTDDSKRFQQVLLVGFGNWYYASDAGGLSILLYDRTKRRVILPDLSRLLTTALKKECSIRVGMPFSFDALSRVHLRLADDVDEGDEEPTTHCFQGQEEWVFDPGRGTLHSTSVH